MKKRKKITKCNFYQMHINHWNLRTFSMYNKKPRNQKLLFSNLKRSALAKKIKHSTLNHITSKLTKAHLNLQFNIAKNNLIQNYTFNTKSPTLIKTNEKPFPQHQISSQQTKITNYNKKFTHNL